MRTPRSVPGSTVQAIIELAIAVAIISAFIVPPCFMYCTGLLDMVLFDLRRMFAVSALLSFIKRPSDRGRAIYAELDVLGVYQRKVSAATFWA